MSAPYEIKMLSREDLPPALLEIPQVPEMLYVAGELPDPTQYYYLAVVGSRKYTSYGREACERIIKGLAGYPICIVSGLAMGIDGIAHRAALDAGLRTVAIPGSGLDPSVIYPRTHLNLAREIVENGGALISEFEQTFRAAPWTFPQRNRIMAGITQGTLVVEAEEKSGTLITARLATEYNRNVFTVPGPIFSATSKGTNNLLRQGATPITSTKDLLEEIGFVEQTFGLPAPAGGQAGTLDLTLFTPEEQAVLILLDEPREREELLASLDTPPAQTLSILTVLEIKGVIQERMGKIERI
ncbi:MAG: DNA-protecting protein DprA [Candidatus Yonathbacteria bacterium]|nr:DNA-protecting protein DprA [Candidatus Yonathbacteria bacterium]